MTAIKTRKMTTGEPGNPGEFGTLRRTDSEVELLAESTPTLFDSVDPKWVIGIAEDESTPPEVLAELALSKNDKVRAAVAGNPTSPASTHVAFADDEAIRVIESLAWNQTINADVIEKLIIIDDPDIAEGLADHPGLSLEHQEIIAANEHDYIRMELARNTKTHPQVLTALAGDADRGVRSKVAKNPTTPEAARINLASDPEVSVRVALAAGRNPVSVQMVLARDEDSEVRLDLLRSPGLDLGVLGNLRMDKDPYVSGEATHRLDRS